MMQVCCGEIWIVKIFASNNSAGKQLVLDGEVLIV